MDSQITICNNMLLLEALRRNEGLALGASDEPHTKVLSQDVDTLEPSFLSC